MIHYNLNKLDVKATIGYSSKLNKYLIGLDVGKAYTILDDTFDSEQEAAGFIYKNLLNI